MNERTEKNVRSGQVRLGQVRIGQDRLGQVRLGQVRLRQVRFGRVMLGQVTSGQVWTDEFRLGFVRLGLDRSGQVGSAILNLGYVNKKICMLIYLLFYLYTLGKIFSLGVGQAETTLIYGYTSTKKVEKPCIRLHYIRFGQVTLGYVEIC